MSENIRELESNKSGDWAWRVALPFPPQGSWTEQDYLSLDSGRLVEYADGSIEVHDTPTIEHQRIVRYLFGILAQCVHQYSMGEVFFAPLPVQLWRQKFREPDIVFISSNRDPFTGNYPDGADLVIEVVSEGNDARIRDVTIKVDEYAKAKITEYWVVDPMTEQVIVYRDPSEGKYLLTEKFCRGQEVVSGQFSVAQIAVSAVFDARNFPVRRQGE